jgi:DNA-binding Lrp family transcriptional regulator
MESPISWTFFTNHTHVLVYLSLYGNAPLREIAGSIGITERAVQRIVAELEDSKVLTKKKIGRNNCYIVNGGISLRHPLERHCTIGEILKIIAKKQGHKKTGPTSKK